MPYPFYDLHAVAMPNSFPTQFYWQDIKINNAFAIDRKEGINDRQLYEFTESAFFRKIFFTHKLKLKLKMEMGKSHRIETKRVWCVFSYHRIRLLLKWEHNSFYFETFAFCECAYKYEFQLSTILHILCIEFSNQIKYSVLFSVEEKNCTIVCWSHSIVYSIVCLLASPWVQSCFVPRVEKNVNSRDMCSESRHCFVSSHCEEKKLWVYNFEWTWDFDLCKISVRPLKKTAQIEYNV